MENQHPLFEFNFLNDGNPRQVGPCLHDASRPEVPHGEADLQIRRVAMNMF
jgi:hypothetical protein